MTTADYILTAALALVVLRQTRERRVDLRSFLVPLVAVFFVAQAYVHSIPASGSDVLFVAALAGIGLTLGLLGGLATHIRFDDGKAFARAGWLACGLLVAGIGSRLAFAVAMHHGAAPAVRDFSVAHHIAAAAWPVALVSMAILEVVVRQVVVQLRGRRIV